MGKKLDCTVNVSDCMKIERWRGKGSGEGFGAASTSDHTADLKKLPAGQQGALEQRLLQRVFPWERNGQTCFVTVGGLHGKSMALVKSSCGF